MGRQAAGTGGVGAADSPPFHPSERPIGRGVLYRLPVQGEGWPWSRRRPRPMILPL